MNHKSILLMLSLMVAVSLLLGACSSEATEVASPDTDVTDEQQVESTEAAAPVEKEKEKVVIFVGFGTGTDPEQIVMQEALAEDFNKAHDDIEIEFLIVPVAESDERFLSMVAGGNPPDLVSPIGSGDIFKFPEIWADLSPFINADNYNLGDFYESLLTVTENPEGRTVALPFGVFPGFILYNKDMFDAAGLDYPTHDDADESWTWDKFREMALLLTVDANGNNANSPDFDPDNIVQWGFDDSWATGAELLTPWGAPNGGRATTDDHKTAVANSEEWVTGLQFMIDGVWEDHFIPDYAGQDAYYATSGDPFSGNMVAMFKTHTWFFPEGLVELPFEYDIAPMPFSPNGTRMAPMDLNSIAMTEDSKSKEATWEVMKWLISQEHGVEVCLIYGCMPPRISLEDDYRETLLERWPELDHDVVYSAIEFAENPSQSAWMPSIARIYDIMNSMPDLIYSGVSNDAQAILDETNANIQKILDDYWAEQ